MDKLTYTPNLTGLIVILDAEEQEDLFFYKGHPQFDIPDFDKGRVDIWLSFLSYVEKKIGHEVYDQDGGEITSYEVIDVKSGLTKLTYTAYGITIDENSDPIDIEVEMEGYVVQEPADGSTFFYASLVEIPKII